MPVEELLVAKLFQLLGTDDLEQAIKNIEAERQGMRELNDENTALKIYNRILRLVVEFASQIFDDLEGEGGMFLSPKTRNLISKSRNQIALARKAITESKALAELEHKG